MSRSMTRDEFVELAIFSYGPKWQTPLAEELRVERRALVRDIASDKPIPSQSVEVVLSQVDRKIERMQREYGAFLERVERLKREIDFDPPKRATRNDDREIAS